MNTCPHPDIEADPIGPGATLLGWPAVPVRRWEVGGVGLGWCKCLRLLDF